MLARLCVSFTVGFWMLATTSRLDEEQQERARLEGTWEIVKSGVAKKVVAHDFETRGKVTFQGSRMIITLGEQKLAESVYILALKREPHGIYATPVDGPGKGLAWEGIYTLEGDTLTLLFSDPGKAAPKIWSKNNKKKAVVLKRAPL
ncbi:MAG TPA: TIGR03067 domain-containing protein [Gemmataceae bacterium]|nr:TIGR03067 domain-containing protein [Gemmataceae bacterium]